MQIDIQEFILLLDNKCIACQKELDLLPFPLNFDKFTRCHSCNRMHIFGGNFNSIYQVEVEYKNYTIIYVPEGIFVYNSDEKILSKIRDVSAIKDFIKVCKYYCILV